jgi:chromosome segregation ATPase
LLEFLAFLASALVHLHPLSIQQKEQPMKINRLLGITIAIALVTMVGCAKTFKEGTKTATSIQNVEREARVGQDHVNATMAALDDMFNNQEGDLKEQFKSYSKSLDKLDSQAKRVKKQGETMASTKADYLQQWDAQMATIESKTIRQTGEQRRKNVEEMFTKVKSEMDAAGKVFDPFMSKLNDIRTAMSMDLNRNGLNAMRPVATEAKADAVVINKRLDGAISTLSKAATALSSSGG